MTCLEDIITSHCIDNNIRFEINQFNQGSQLYQHLNVVHQYHMIFLAVDLEDMSGIEIGRKIRYDLDDEQTELIFVMKNTNQILELFKLRIYDVLLIPIKDHEVTKILDQVHEKRINQLKRFQYQVQKSYNWIEWSKILYFKSDNRKMTLYMEDGEIHFYDSVKNVRNRTDGRFFWKIHRSYIINTQHVVKYELDKVYIDNGAVLPISHNHIARVKDLLEKFC